MSQAIEVKVPDIGDYKDVPVIEVLVKPGDAVEPEQSLVTLESDKATMDVPSPSAGTVKEVKVKVGDAVSQGSLIVLLDGAQAAAQPAQANGAATSAAATIARAARRAPLGNKQGNDSFMQSRVVSYLGWPAAPPDVSEAAIVPRTLP